MLYLRDAADIDMVAGWLMAQVSCRRHNPYLSLRALRCERYGL